MQSKTGPVTTTPNRPLAWWHPRRRFSRTEIVADGIVHGVGLAIAIAAGSVLLTIAALQTAREELPALITYVVTLVAVLTVSLAYNLAPLTQARQVLARLDQATIFLFIAGTYTPFLAVLGGTPMGVIMTSLVWGTAVVGMALKLIVPHKFGRLAIVLYLGIGWSGVAMFKDMAAALPPSTLWLLLAGGITYSAGIIFHLWDRLRFQNVLWHVFVVLGALIHLWAVIDWIVINRL